MINFYRSKMRDRFANGPADPPRGISLPKLAAIALPVLLVGWLALETRRLRGELDRLRSREQTGSLEHRNLESRELELEDELAQRRHEAETLQRQLAERDERIADLERDANDRPTTPAPLTLSMVLSIARIEPPNLALPADAEFAELHADLAGNDGYSSYRATVTTPDGASLWTGSDLNVRTTEWGSEVVMRLPAKLLTEAEYLLTLEGRDAEGNVHTLSTHEFGVIRSPG